MDADKTIQKALSKLDIQSLTRVKKSSCVVMQGRQRLIEMMHGIRKDLKKEISPSGFYDVTIEMFNSGKYLSDDEDDFLYKVTGLLLIESQLYNIGHSGLIEFYNREKHAHMCSITITASLFRNEKFRHKKYRKLFDALTALNRLL